MVHIRKRTDSKGMVSYQVIIESAPDPMTGKRQRTYKTVHGTRKQAEALARQMQNELELGHVLSLSSMKLKDWMVEWLDNYLPGIAPSTRVGYKEKINSYIIPAMGDIALKDLKTEQIQRWINHLLNDKKLAPKTIKNAFQNLKSALDKAVQLQKINRNPCTGAALPPGEKYIANFYNNNDIKAMLNAAKGTDMYLIVMMQTYFGCRRGELCALKWSDVDFKNNILHINKSASRSETGVVIKSTKTKASIRDIHFGKDMENLLRKAHLEYKANKLAMGPAFKDGNNVISKKDGSAYRPDSLTQKWLRFIEVNHLKPIRLHDLRHTSATILAQSGLGYSAVQQHLGHSTSKMTMEVYTHCTTEMKQAAAQEMENVLF